MPTSYPTSESLKSDGFPRLGLHRYAIFTAFATFFLVIAGGLVTSTGSGLSVPDWPLSFGQWMPPMEGGVLYEHGHRMVASFIGLLTIILALWLWRVERPGVRSLGWWALGLVILQGLLGGLTVLLKLPPQVSILHGVLGPSFFALTVCIAVLTGTADLEPVLGEAVPLRKLQRLALITLVLVFVQMIFGAIYRHTGWGLHLHLTGAVLVLVHVILLVRRVYRQERDATAIRRPAMVLGGLTVIQLCLGGMAWWRPNISITTAHQATGATILASCLVLVMQVFLRRKPE